MGEIHPLVRENYDFPLTPVLAAEFDLEALISAANLYFENKPIFAFPAVFEDIAVIVDEEASAANILDEINKAGANCSLPLLSSIFTATRKSAQAKEHGVYPDVSGRGPYADRQGRGNDPQPHCQGAEEQVWRRAEECNRQRRQV